MAGGLVFWQVEDPAPRFGRKGVKIIFGVPRISQNLINFSNWRFLMKQPLKYSSGTWFWANDFSGIDCKESTLAKDILARKKFCTIKRMISKYSWLFWKTTRSCLPEINFGLSQDSKSMSISSAFVAERNGAVAKRRSKNLPAGRHSFYSYIKATWIL